MGDMADYYGYHDPEPDLEEMEEMEEIKKKSSKRLDWMNLWDKLRNDLKTKSKQHWTRAQILDLMDKLEREMIREFERE